MTRAFKPARRQAPLRNHHGDARLDDGARFLRSWFERPLVAGFVAPSGRPLARMMASFADPQTSGPVIEFGPGTGPVTDALIERGIAEHRLVLVEYNREFCKLLERRYPKAKVLHDDAYCVREAGAFLGEAPAAVLSSLPLLTKPLQTRVDLLLATHEMMAPGSPFVQFTYGMAPPIPPRMHRCIVTSSDWIWLNIPPVRVWVYRRETAEAGAGSGRNSG